MTAVPPADGPAAGYYPDPSIPGYVRYWDGLGWTPGTSRPAPADGEELPTPRAAARSSAPSLRFVPPPVPQRLLPPIDAEPDQTGPIFLDETGPLPEPRAERYQPALVAPAAEAGAEPVADSGTRWLADAAQQRGLLETGLAPRWVSWGATAPAEPEEFRVTRPRDPALTEPAPAALAPADPQAEARARAHALAQAEALALAQANAQVNAQVNAQAQAQAEAEAQAETLAAAEAQADAEALALASHQAQQWQTAPTPPPPAEASPTPALAATPPPASGRFPAPTATAPPRPRPAPAPAAARSTSKTGVKTGAPAPGRRVVGPRPALLGRRLAARLFDMAVVGGAVAAAGAPVIARGVTHLQDRIDAARLLPGQTTVWLLDQQTLADLGLLLLGLLIAGLFYEAVPTALWGRTLGKALFGLRVLDRRSKSKPGFGGSLARWLSYQLMLVLLVGVFDLLWCMVDRPWRQCWHDKIGRTFVTPSRPAAAPGE